MPVFTAVREWWRGRVRWSPRRGGTRSRVALPAVVDIPPGVLESLRGEDERFDAYVLPDGRVWLLFKSDRPARVLSGRKELASARDEGFGEPMYAASLMAQGFELIEEFPTVLGMSAGFMRRIAHEWNHLSEAEVRRRSAIRRALSDGTAHKARARAVMEERVRLEGRSDYAWAFKGRRSYSNVK
jgi:hypothetical protein